LPFKISIYITNIIDIPSLSTAIFFATAKVLPYHFQLTAKKVIDR